MENLTLEQVAQMTQKALHFAMNGLDNIAVHADKQGFVTCDASMLWNIFDNLRDANNALTKALEKVEQ